MPTDEISFEEFAGGSGPAPQTSSSLGGGKPSSPADEVSFAEFTKAPEQKREDEFSPEALSADNWKQTLFGSGAAKQSAGEAALGSLKRLGGEAGALADFVLSVPGFMVQTGAELGGALQAAASGIPLSADSRQLNPVTAFTVGREAGQRFGGPLMNPVQKLVSMIGGDKFYEEAKTSKGLSAFGEAMEKAGKWVEEATGGKISRDSIPMLADTLMTSLAGVKGGKDIGKLDPELVKRVKKQAQESAEKMHAEAELEAQESAVTPQEAAAREPIQQQINDLLGIRSPAEQAKITRQRRGDVKRAFTAPEEGGDFGSPEESQFRAEERMRNERDFTLHPEALEENAQRGVEPEGYEVSSTKRPERIGQAEILRIMQKPGYERTAEDLITLREARKQGGKMDPVVAMLLGSAGIGAAVGGELSDDKLKGAVLGGLVGSAPFALLGGLGAGGVKSRFGQAGAVKGPGGMWHPEAVERLSEPLGSKVAKRSREQVEAVLRDQPIKYSEETLAEVARDKAAFGWSDKAIRNYLNRYAGTEKDPLKDVEIPFGGGTKTWGELSDKSFEPLSDFDLALNKKLETPGFDKLRPGESVFGLPKEAIYERPMGEPVPELQAIKSYLSHVGDYLRQNVKPEDLQKYDLVRAVQETAKNDARVAKEMEKAQAASTKELPVYKAYPNGYKWVELKLPEKLTEEQNKTVRPLTKEERSYSPKGEPYDTLGTTYGKEGYVAVQPDGKMVVNAYTGEPAAGKTPEEAWLAGRLAEEGNQMGHCVGGYCPSVASGESRIFSLRDEKGKSHVTVEVEPNGSLSERNFAGERNTADNIVQIKGKQNRAPNKEYLPYVQDFVKSQKWGQILDFQNTGLWETHQGPITDAELLKRISALHRETMGRIPEVTEEQLREYRNGYVPRDNPVHQAITTALDLGKTDARAGRYGTQEGFVDQKLVAGLSAMGLGALVGAAVNKDKGEGALLGALAGAALLLPGAKERLKQVADAADYGIGLISTRLGNVSQPLKLRAREYERRVLTDSYNYVHRAAPFMKAMHDLPATKRAVLTDAILNGDREAIATLMKGNAPLVASWREVRNILSELGTQLQGHGRFRTMLEDYFPRLVKDLKGLKEALDAPLQTRLEKALADANKASIKNRGTPLSAVEQSSIINRELQGYRRVKGYQKGFTKQRGVEDVSGLQQFYHTPAESLYAYIRGAVQDIEMAKFFGRDLVQIKKGGSEYTNIDDSIGNVVGRELAEGKITPEQVPQLEKLLQSRFKQGERSPNSWIQGARNLANMGLLGSAISAVTQLGDVATALYAQDFRSTLTAVARLAAGNQKILAKDFGLADHVAEELVSPGRTANWLGKVLRSAAFTAVDRFGKNTHLNAALGRVERLSRSVGGIKQLHSEYGEAFGDKFPQLVRDLQEGKITENVRAYLFSELSDMQPISKLEMPQAYLDHPNGRIIYMLKTFMLKQLDIARRDGLQEIRKGNVAKGMKNLTEYGLLLGLSGAGTQMVQDWLLGRDAHFEASDVLENMLKTFGWGEYIRSKAAAGHPIEAAVSAFAPPYKMMDDIIRLDPKFIQYIPLIGKLYYNWELGGREAAEIRRKSKTKEPLSGRAEDYRDRKREAARQRREEKE